MTIQRHKFERRGLLALAPEAFGVEYDAPSTEAESTTPMVAVVRVCGPLEHHRNPWFDSYDALLDRVELACSTPASNVVLVIDSPGGVTSGLFETATLIRDAVEASGKKLAAYVEGTCCSAAYALACAADTIGVSSTSLVGSVGVIDTRVDVTRADAAMGVQFEFVTSGTTKAFGNPHLAISDEERSERQVIVDQLAQVFFDHVKERRGLDTQPLQARIYAGQAAVAAGLADRVSSYPDFLSGLLASAAEPGVTMSVADEARTALQKMAESDDEEMAKKAKAALAALDAEDQEDEEKKDDTEAEAPEEEEDKEARASTRAGTVSASTAVDLAAQVQALSAEIAQVRSLHEAGERKALFASRPDVSADLKKVLKNKPLAEVKEILAAIPRKGSNLAAAAVGNPVQGNPAAGSNLHGAPSATSETEKINALMGLGKPSTTAITFSDAFPLSAPKGA